MIICAQCGTENSDQAEVCARCGVAFAEAPRPPAAEGQPVENRLREVEEAVRRVVSGELSPQEFGQMMSHLSAELAAKEQEIRDIELPPEALQAFREELEAGFGGMKLFKEGVQTLLRYGEDPRQEHLDSGLELVRQGNARLNYAVELNRQARQVLEKLYQDYQSQNQTQA
jgi:hypothetical protein